MLRAWFKPSNDALDTYIASSAFREELRNAIPPPKYTIMSADSNGVYLTVSKTDGVLCAGFRARPCYGADRFFVRRVGNGCLLESALFPGRFVTVAGGGTATVTCQPERAVLQLVKTSDGAGVCIMQNDTLLRGGNVVIKESF